jgi:hypothetical protein
LAIMAVSAVWASSERLATKAMRRFIHSACRM